MRLQYIIGLVLALALNAMPAMCRTSFAATAARLEQAGADSAAVARFLDSLAVSGKQYAAFLEFAEQRINNPADTLHSEPLYLAVLRHAARTVPADARERVNLLLANAMKNRIGTPAADFAYVTADGREHRLSDIETPLTLIYFNDPDCDACRRIKARMDSSSELQSLVHARKLTVLGIYTLGDENLWRATEYPNWMVNGWDKAQAIEGAGLYDLTSMPVFYLLGDDRTVILKNEASLNRVLRTLSALTQPH